MNENQRESLTQTLIQLTKNREPRSVEELVHLVKERFSIPDLEIIEHIILLQSQGKIMLTSVPKQRAQKLSIYLKRQEAYWYWATLCLAATITIAALAIPENAYPLVYVRYVLGTVFVVWLPGYSFIKALFPTAPPSRASPKSLDNKERFALSIGLSMALVPIIGLILNFTPWGIRLTPIIFSLLLFTTIFATIAIIREYKSQRKKTLEKTK